MAQRAIEAQSPLRSENGAVLTKSSTALETMASWPYGAHG